MDTSLNKKLSTMPLCQGRALGPGHVQPCPEYRCDDSVRNRQGDLFLCDGCSEFRFPSKVDTHTASLLPITACDSAEEQDVVHVADVGVVVIDEVLFFFKSAFMKGTVDMLKTLALSFYSADQLSMAKSKLQTTAKSIGTEGLGRIKKRTGPNKAKSEVDDLILILQLIDEQKLDNRMPTYVAANIDHLPTTPVDGLDMVILAKKLQTMEQRLNGKYDELTTRLSSIEASQSVPRSESDSTVTNENYKLLESRVAALEMNQAASVRSVMSDGGFAVLESRVAALEEGRPVVQSPAGTHGDGEIDAVIGVGPGDYQSVTDNVTAQVDSLSGEQRPLLSFAGQLRQDASTAAKKDWFKNMKSSRTNIVGRANSAALKSAKVIKARKLVFQVDNIDCSHSVDDVVRFLHKIGVDVHTCFLVKSWMKGDCLAMRVCIFASDRDKFMNANRWPAGVVIRPWKFKTIPSNSA